MPNIIIAVRIPETLKKQIEAYIKREYPRFKTVSDVVREALREFLSKQLGEAH